MAQQTTGTVLGTVSDPQGAVLPGVKITVTNTATGITHPATTDKDGTFHVLDLPIGTYVVTAEHEGFAKLQTDPQTLQINQNIRFDIKMKVGTQQEVVDVSDAAAGVETVSSTLGQSVTSRPIVDLPLNGRDVLQLAKLQPGVTETNDDNTGAGNFSIAGGRTDSVTFLLDGGVNNDLLSNGVVYNPNPDSIAEFRILQNNYTAEYGRNGGGVISVVTKSGTNAFHGTAFEFLRNDAFNANTFFNKANDIPRDVLKRNQYGGTFGGPILKDKLFFFVSYQGQRLTSKVNPLFYGDSSASTQVFTTDQLKGNFNGDPGVAAFLQNFPYFLAPGTTPSQAMIDPTKFDPVAQKYIAAGLIPSTSNPSGLIFPTGTHTDNYNELSFKVDYNLTEKDKLSATLGGHKDNTLDPYEFASVNGFPNTNGLDNYFLNIAYTRTISNTMLNEFRFTAQRNNILQEYVSGSNSQYTASSVGLGVTPDQATGPTNLWFDTNLFIGYSEQGPTHEADNTFSYADTFSWAKGHHNWKFGAGFTPYQNNTLYDYYVNGEMDFYGGLNNGVQGVSGTFNSYADFLLGLPGAYYQYPSAPSNIRSKQSFFFAQDEWHVTPRLVLNLGVRYEYSTPKLDTQGRSFSVIPGQQSTVFPNAPLGLVFPGDAGAPNGANFPDKNDFAPRFGFAWDPTGTGKTSIRGGFGVFYDVLKGEDNLQFNGQPPFFSSVGLYFGDPGTSGDPSCASQGQTTGFNYLSNPFSNSCAGSSANPNPFPSKPVSHNIDFGAAGFLPFNSGGSVYIVDPHLRTPYVMQDNLSIEHEIANNTTVDVTYVGSMGRKLTSLVDINPFDLATSFTPNATRILNEQGGNVPAINANYGYAFSAMPEFRNVASQSYNALEASITRQPTKTWNLGDTYFTVGYTYSHSIDNASGFRQRSSGVPYYNPDEFRASSDLDMRHRITISGGWDLAIDHWWESGWKRLTQGWSVFPIFTWHTGLPFDIPARFGDRYDPTNVGPSGAGDPALAYVNVVGPTNTLNPRTSYAGLGPYYWFNPNSFSNANETSYGSPYGDLGRNHLRAPDFTNLDFEFAKTTKFTERLSMQLRCEMFNVLNHAEFRPPDTNINDGTFGQLTGTYDPRIIQLAVRFAF